MKNVLVISGHPNLKASIVNKVIIDDLKKSLPNADIRTLDSLYPDYQIDIQSEQQALLKADIIIWQFPFYWYSMPALMKKWLDDVFLHGFSHGSNAKLAGKKLFISFTTGAPFNLYAKDSLMKHTLEDYMASFESTAILCNLEFAGIMYLNGVSYAGRNEEVIKNQQNQASDYSQKLIKAIKDLAK